MIPLLPLHMLARGGDGLDTRLVALLAASRSHDALPASNVVALDLYRQRRQTGVSVAPSGLRTAQIDDIAAARMRRASRHSR